VFVGKPKSSIILDLSAFLASRGTYVHVYECTESTTLRMALCRTRRLEEETASRLSINLLVHPCTSSELRRPLSGVSMVELQRYEDHRRIPSDLLVYAVDDVHVDYETALLQLGELHNRGKLIVRITDRADTVYDVVSVGGTYVDVVHVPFVKNHLELLRRAIRGGPPPVRYVGGRYRRAIGYLADLLIKWLEFTRYHTTA